MMEKNEACEEYMLDRKTADSIIREVKNAIAAWRQTANLCQIPKGEQERFAHRLEWTV